MVKKPKFDLTKLMELHGDAGNEDSGAAVPREGEGEEVAAAEKDIEKAASGGRL